MMTNFVKIGLPKERNRKTSAILACHDKGKNLDLTSHDDFATSA